MSSLRNEIRSALGTLRSPATIGLIPPTRNEPDLLSPGSLLPFIAKFD